MKQENTWLDWAVELQALAQAGLYYSKDPFDQERFQRIRDIAAEQIQMCFEAYRAEDWQTLLE